MNNNIKIACPICYTILNSQSVGLACAKCKKSFSYKEGIPSFTEVSPLFEGRFKEHIKNSKFEKKRFYLFLENFDISRRRISFLKKCLKLLNKNSLILDIGCGGGGCGVILKRYGYVIGLDISIGSLQYAKNIYEDVIHASVSRIPFTSNYFDAVVSEDVLGHIPFSEKDKTYTEMYRVLKPGGLMVHSAIETDSNSFWFRFAKKYPELFQRHHVEKHGHIGLELPSVIVERCNKIGFNIKKVEKMHAIILYPSIISAWFDNEYRNKSAAISAIVAISNTIQKSKKVEFITNLFVGSIEKVMNSFVDVNQATGLLLCCEK
jgi:ubiquinone/menaquinone biosynthesis C-methylase UbiE